MFVHVQFFVFFLWAGCQTRKKRRDTRRICKGENYREESRTFHSLLSCLKCCISNFFLHGPRYGTYTYLVHVQMHIYIVVYLGMYMYNVHVRACSVHAPSVQPPFIYNLVYPCTYCMACLLQLHASDIPFIIVPITSLYPTQLHSAMIRWLCFGPHLDLHLISAIPSPMIDYTLERSRGKKKNKIKIKIK